MPYWLEICHSDLSSCKGGWEGRFVIQGRLENCESEFC